MFLLHGLIRKIVILQFVLILQCCPGNGSYKSRSAYTCYSDPICQQKTSCDSDCCKVWIKNEYGACRLHLPEDYRPPVFTYCPSNTHQMAVFVSDYRNIGYLHNIGITAEDWEKNPLPVTLSKRRFRHCRCSDSHENVTATAKDKYGSIVRCYFTVIVKDIHPPTFNYCPKDQRVPSTEQLMWKNPIVTDNVGVKQLIPPAYLNKKRYGPGLYNMVYAAIDWDENVAKCTFRITVTDIGDEKLKSLSVDSTVAISGTIVGALFIILIVITTAMFRLCRKRHQLRNRTRRQPSTIGMICSQPNSTEDNHVFTIYNNAPSPYEIIAKDRLPNYSLRDDPPSYEEIEQQSDQGEDNLAFSISESRENVSEEDLATGGPCPSVTSTVKPDDISVIYHIHLQTNPQSIQTEV